MKKEEKIQIIKWYVKSKMYLIEELIVLNGIGIKIL